MSLSKLEGSCEGLPASHFLTFRRVCVLKGICSIWNIPVCIFLFHRLEAQVSLLDERTHFIYQGRGAFPTPSLNIKGAATGRPLTSLWMRAQSSQGEEKTLRGPWRHWLCSRNDWVSLHPNWQMKKRKTAERRLAELPLTFLQCANSQRLVTKAGIFRLLLAKSHLCKWTYVVSANSRNANYCYNLRNETTCVCFMVFSYGFI